MSDRANNEFMKTMPNNMELREVRGSLDALVRRLRGLEQQSHKLCHAIEELPASEQQTGLSTMASEIAHGLNWLLNNAGEYPNQPPISNEHVAEGCEQFSAA